MSEELMVSDVIPAPIERVYRAFLSSEEHSAMTGSTAVASDEVGGALSAWEGYIHGTNLALEPFTRIVQSWRAADFPADAADSTLEIVLAPKGSHTQITLMHTNLPDGMGGGFTEGWQKFYLAPMHAYFTSRAPDHTDANDAVNVAATKKTGPRKAVPRKAAPKKAATKKAAPKKAASKKAAPKKAASKKAASKKAASKKAASKKAVPRGTPKKAASKKK